MAVISKFKNAIKGNIGNIWTTLYTAPVGPDKDSYFIELDISSVGTTGVQVSVRVVDVSAGETAHLCKQAPVPIGSALQVIDGQKIVLEAGDKIEVICDTPGEVVDAIGSLIEDVNN